MLGNGGKGGLQCGRRFTEQEIEQVCETVRTFPALPLTELAKTICEHLGWYTAGGAPKRDACQKLLGELEAGGRGRVVNLSRHLIFPWVEVRNLSSHVLGLVGRQIAGDWEKRWGYRPVLLETFVDPRQHPGSSYKAAGWNELGMTSGEGLVRPGQRYRTTPKRIFVKPLSPDFRALLVSELPPARGLQ